MTNQNYIKIFDTTLRDGEQSPGASMNIEEKLKIAAALEDGELSAAAQYLRVSPCDQGALRGINKP